MGVLDVCMSVPVCADLWAWVVSAAQVTLGSAVREVGIGDAEGLAW